MFVVYEYEANIISMDTRTEDAI